MKAFGYQAGSAAVDYEWGVGVGATCGGIAWLQCDEGLFCKDWMEGVADAAGSCHTRTFCASDRKAPSECKDIPHIMAVGYWGCEDYTCTYKLGANPMCVDASRDYVSQDPNQCKLVRYTCEAGKSSFSDSCGCGCE